MFPQWVNDDLAAGVGACVFETRVTVIAVGDDLDQRAQYILADRLIRLLQGYPVGVLQLASSNHLLAFLTYFFDFRVPACFVIVSSMNENLSSQNAKKVDKSLRSWMFTYSLN